MNCSSNDQVCWEDALPSDECELPDDGTAGFGKCGAIKGVAGCVNGNPTGMWKLSCIFKFLFGIGKLICREFS